jgi:hypothetical protein
MAGLLALVAAACAADPAAPPPPAAPALRLVTCAGAFDREQRSYRDNLVVEAAIAADPAPRRGAGG